MAHILSHENRERFLKFLRKHKYYFVALVIGFFAGSLFLAFDFLGLFAASAPIQMGIYILASGAGLSLFKGIFDTIGRKYFSKRTKGYKELTDDSSQDASFEETEQSDETVEYDQELLRESSVISFVEPDSGRQSKSEQTLSRENSGGSPIKIANQPEQTDYEELRVGGASYVSVMPVLIPTVDHANPKFDSVLSDLLQIKKNLKVLLDDEDILLDENECEVKPAHVLKLLRQQLRICSQIVDAHKAVSNQSWNSLRKLSQSIDNVYWKISSVCSVKNSKNLIRETCDILETMSDFDGLEISEQKFCGVLESPNFVQFQKQLFGYKKFSQQGLFVLMHVSKLVDRFSKTQVEIGRSAQTPFKNEALWCLSYCRNRLKLSYKKNHEGCLKELDQEISALYWEINHDLNETSSSSVVEQGELLGKICKKWYFYCAVKKKSKFVMVSSDVPDSSNDPVAKMFSLVGHTVSNIVSEVNEGVKRGVGSVISVAKPLGECVNNHVIKPLSSTAEKVASTFFQGSQNFLNLCLYTGNDIGRPSISLSDLELSIKNLGEISKLVEEEKFSKSRKQINQLINSLCSYYHECPHIRSSIRSLQDAFLSLSLTTGKVDITKDQIVEVSHENLKAAQDTLQRLKKEMELSNNSSTEQPEKGIPPRNSYVKMFCNESINKSIKVEDNKKASGEFGFLPSYIIASINDAPGVIAGIQKREKERLDLNQDTDQSSLMILP